MAIHHFKYKLSSMRENDVINNLENELYKLQEKYPEEENLISSITIALQIINNSIQISHYKILISFDRNLSNEIKNEVIISLRKKALSLGIEYLELI